jgi:hypothetical protein
MITTASRQMSRRPDAGDLIRRPLARPRSVLVAHKARTYLALYATRPVEPSLCATGPERRGSWDTAWPECASPGCNLPEQRGLGYRMAGMRWPLDATGPECAGAGCYETGTARAQGRTWLKGSCPRFPVKSAGPTAAAGASASRQPGRGVWRAMADRAHSGCPAPTSAQRQPGIALTAAG